MAYEHEKHGMIDNRKVKDSHQEGIKRVEGAAKGCPLGRHGKMHEQGKANFRREDGSLTPRRG